ncbi:MAG: hypothetical protein J0I43_10760 [Microbacterium sp.]|uniref:hypothetical protein n=1 Tax=Microbacterium sp. TaxID=51671 RepID=UPI001ACB94AD|nr:hypothetical protein [Microbacterium sp.]MBN9177836.1 hypothetical protein [Microbacterium sp.]
MTHTVFVVLYLITMGAIIIAVDVLFLRDHVWIRLGVNVGVVALFAVLYLTMLKDAFK